jgi:predicted ester cyclase
MSNIVVKLFTRPTIRGTRTWVEVNPKLDYPQGTVFILRWLPKGSTNYRTKTLTSKMGLCWERLRPTPVARLTTLNSVAEGEWVVVRCTYSGTHRGTSRFPVDGGLLMGVQPTGRTFEVQHIHMYRVLDGKIAEHFANRDDIGMMRQLGLLPSAPSLSGQ